MLHFRCFHANTEGDSTTKWGCPLKRSAGNRGHVGACLPGKDSWTVSPERQETSAHIFLMTVHLTNKIIIKEESSMETTQAKIYQRLDVYQCYHDDWLNGKFYFYLKNIIFFSQNLNLPYRWELLKNIRFRCFECWTGWCLYCLLVPWSLHLCTESNIKKQTKHFIRLVFKFTEPELLEAQYVKI